jgi:predicted ATPase
MAHLTRIRMAECRNVRDLDIDLSVPPVENGTSGVDGAGFRHLILTGPNGSGKSGVLEEIKRQAESALYSSDEAAPGERALRNETVLTWQLPKKPYFAADEGAFLAVYLPARRRVHPQKVAGPSKLNWDPGSLRPTTEASERLLQFLVNKRTEQALAAEDRDSAAAERTREWFTRFEEHLRRLMEDDSLTVEFDRRAWNFRFQRRDGYAFDLNGLADGHAAVLTILAELLIRVDVIQEARGDFTFEPEGVVIIDEIEAHLHLSLQEQILPFLTELFPRFQFLVATHSPAVIASIPNAVVYDLQHREATLSDHYRGIRYGMLATEHFGISSEIDLHTTAKLGELRELAQRPSRTSEDERTIARLSSELLALSPAMAVEIWAIKERLGEPDAVVGAGR